MLDVYGDGKLLSKNVSTVFFKLLFIFYWKESQWKFSQFWMAKTIQDFNSKLQQKSEILKNTTNIKNVEYFFNCPQKSYYPTSICS